MHDELVFEVPAEEREEVTQQVTMLMSGAAQLAIPLEVEVGEGSNWEEAH